MPENKQINVIDSYESEFGSIPVTPGTPHTRNRHGKKMKKRALKKRFIKEIQRAWNG